MFSGKNSSHKLNICPDCSVFQSNSHALNCINVLEKLILVLLRLADRKQHRSIICNSTLNRRANIRETQNLITHAGCCRVEIVEELHAKRRIPPCQSTKRTDTDVMGLLSTAKWVIMNFQNCPFNFLCLSHVHTVQRQGFRVGPKCNGSVHRQEAWTNLLCFQIISDLLS